MRLLVKFPTRQRHDLFFRTLSQYIALSQADITVLASLDFDDPSMANQHVRHRLDDLGSRVKYAFGHSKNKVDAINRDMQLLQPAGIEWDVCCLASDDMIPVVYGYDKTILEDAARLMPDLDGVLWYPDGRRTDLVTLAVIGRKWYERKGYIYHPSFESLWCDDWMHYEASREGKLHKLDQVIIKHEWVDATGQDALHRRNEEAFQRDKATFELLKMESEMVVHKLERAPDRNLLILDANDVKPTRRRKKSGS